MGIFHAYPPALHGREAICDAFVGSLGGGLHISWLALEACVIVFK